MEAPGVAPIGAHYLSTKEEFHAYLNQGRESRNNKEEDGGETEKGVGSDLTEPPAKQSKLEEDGEEGSLPETATEDAKEPQGRKRARGQNKSRPCMKPTHYEKDRLCPSIVQERADKCFFGSQCHFLHDVKEYLAKKPPDLGDCCILFETFGKCIYGATCRFARAHFGEDCKNVINVDRLKQWEGKPMVKNSLSKELQQKLRKKKVSFEKSNEYLRSLAKCNHTGGARGHVKGASAMGEKGTPNCSASKGSAEDADLEVAREEMQKVAGTIEKDVPSSVVLEDPCQPVSPVESTLKAVGAVMDEDIVKLRPCEKRKFLDYVHRQPHIERIAVIKSGGYQQVYYCFEIMSFKKRTQLAYQLKLIESASGHCLNLGNQGKLDLQGKLYLAPLTTCGNLPFRRICKRYGADITCGEMAVCTNLLQGQSSEWALLKRHHTEDLFGVQLEGAFPDTMTKCAELLNQAIEVDFVDINVGCPIDLVYKKGGGCALMCRTNKFEQIVRGMDSVLDVPLTVKIRTGVQEKTNLAHKIIPNLREWGAAMVTLHGRSREQRYTKMADWDYIAECAKIASPMPLFGNGDILSFEDANRALQTGVSGIMIARGALIKPWLFTEIKEQRHWDISSSERLDILKDFTNYGLEHWGSDTQGVEKTRKFLLEWLSFLCRYIPAGLLERLPQKINERPPYYVGRDYLETLMASQNVDDWIRISEMLLGPVPSNFTFLPKHKANSYK